MSEHGLPKSTSESVGLALEKIGQGIALAKCRKCGCMLEALDAAERAFTQAAELDRRSCIDTVGDYHQHMEQVDYDCLGCETCWGAEATVLIGDLFGDEVVECGCGSSCNPKAALETTPECICSPSAWPPVPGDYLIGNLSGTVAVCTLASHELPARLIAEQHTSLAIVGKCDTENIGIEKLVKNIIANPAIRWLVLCGVDSRGHCAGDAVRKLKKHGVDASLRILKASSWRPVLKNLSLKEIARFRAQVEIVDLIGNTDHAAIMAAVQECASQPKVQMEIMEPESTSDHAERIAARAPKRLQLDPAGFFIVLPNRATGVIICEHYENSSRLAHIIEGKEAALIAATAVEQGMVTRLDHAAYLGRELAKAEEALHTGVPYEQDAALGKLSDVPTCSDSKCSCH